MNQYWPFSGFVRYGALRERLIVSLDLLSRREALELVDQIGRMVGMFKVGKPLFLSGGPELVREIRNRGGEVFLDLRFHDRPQTVLRWALEATRLGVKMFDVHGSGRLDHMARIKGEIARLCKNEGLRRPHILAVAMLCGMGSSASDASIRQGTDAVVRLASYASEHGLEGVYTSPAAAPRVRSACGRRFTVVTSTVTMRDAAEESSMAMNGAEAIQAGADYLMIGKPISRAREPVRAVQLVLEEIERGLRGSGNSRDSLLARLPF